MWGHYRKAINVEITGKQRKWPRGYYINIKDLDLDIGLGVC